MCEEIVYYYEQELWATNTIYLILSGLALGLFVYSEITVINKPLKAQLADFIGEYGWSFLLAFFSLFLLVLRAFL